MTDVETPTWTYDDGGRAAAGYRGDVGDCVTRAIAIATELPYSTIYAELAERAGRLGARRSARDGVPRIAYGPFLTDLGWHWVPTMAIGSGCRVHLVPHELPAGRLVVRLSGHLVAVVDGVAHDTYDPTRDGRRCVYGYWSEWDGEWVDDDVPAERPVSRLVTYVCPRCGATQSAAGAHVEVWHACPQTRTRRDVRFVPE